MKYAAACVHVKNEESIISEWLSFHRAAGFEHLIVIDNGSSDRTADIVKNFRDRSSVSYLFCPVGHPADFYVQTLKTFGEQFEWMAFIDADEFLYPVSGDDIRNTLSDYREASGIGVYWHTYGSSGHKTKPDGLNIDNFTRRAVSNFHGNRHIKSIVRPRDVWHPLSSHMFHVNGAFMDEQRRVLHRDPPFGFFADIEPSHEVLRINHYHCRSKQQYLEKIERGYFGAEKEKLEMMRAKTEEMWRYSDQNDVEDKSAQRFRNLMAFYL